MNAVASWYRSLDLMMLATPKDKRAVELAFGYGLGLRFEAFADRGYTRAGYLVPRGKPNALLDLDTAVKQAADIAAGNLRSVKGHKLSIVPDTLCVFTETPGSGRDPGRHQGGITGAAGLNRALELRRC